MMMIKTMTMMIKKQYDDDNQEYWWMMIKKNKAKRCPNCPIDASSLDVRY